MKEKLGDNTLSFFLCKFNTPYYEKRKVEIKMELVEQQVKLINEELVALLNVLRVSGVRSDVYEPTLDAIERLSAVRKDLIHSLRAGK